MEARNLAELYDLATLDWAPIVARLDAGLTQAPGTGGPNRHTCWLSSINPDGSPHVTAFGGFWTDGGWFLVTGRTTRKGRNLERDPRCAVSVATDEFDLTVEGTAELVTDPATVARVAEVASGDWPATVDESGTALTAPYSAPSAGPPPWHVYRITARSATALQTVDPGGATRWTFG